MDPSPVTAEMPVKLAVNGLERASSAAAGKNGTVSATDSKRVAPVADAEYVPFPAAASSI